MKKIVVGMFGLMLASSLTLAAPVVYNDATGDLGAAPDNFTGFTHLDISSVSIDNDAVNLYIVLSVVQDPITAPNDWGNYMFGIDSTAGGDASANGNGWARPIQMSANGGMDHWIGSWVNGGGGHQVWSYDGAVWNEQLGSPRAVTLLNNTVSYVVPLADLGLAINDTFNFDVFTSGGGGGDSAVDALSVGTPSITTWGGPYDTGANSLSYTVVPEPSSLALLGAAGLLAMVRRFRRK